MVALDRFELDRCGSRL